MHHYFQGLPTRQAHKEIPEGCYEEEQGRKGFYGPVSHLIRKRPSTRWKNIEGPLRPHLFDLCRLDPTNLDPQHLNYLGQRLLYNSDVAISTVWLQPLEIPSMAERDGDGDRVYFCHTGRGYIFTEYGLLHYSQGSYIVIPKCVAHTFVVSELTQFLVIESKRSFYREPDRGMVGRHGFYDIQALGKPDLTALHEKLQQMRIQIKLVHVHRQEEITAFGYDECIYADVVGWKGDFFPFTLHVDHLMPLMSHRAHLPPSAHTTFVADGFVICTFLPRPLERDEDALKVPFYHQNIDYDEVLFYHKGHFFSRDNLHAGMMTWHPAGFPHGPHPKAVSGISKKTDTDETAVMIDACHPLLADSALSSVEISEYWSSWR